MLKRDVPPSPPLHLLYHNIKSSQNEIKSNVDRSPFGPTELFKFRTKFIAIIIAIQLNV